MIDYLCLKLHKVTEEILDIPFFDAERKFKTYRMMDSMEHSRPITAYPILDEKGDAAVKERITQVTSEFNNLIGFSKEQNKDEEPKDELPSDIMDLFKQHIGEDQLRKDGVLKD